MSSVFDDTVAVASSIIWCSELPFSCKIVVFYGETFGLNELTVIPSAGEKLVFVEDSIVCACWDSLASEFGLLLVNESASDASETVGTQGFATGSDWNNCSFCRFNVCSPFAVSGRNFSHSVSFSRIRSWKIDNGYYPDTYTPFFSEILISEML